jgi:hypothetical protein
MTTELQQVLARYEGARIDYQRAVLSSLHGDAKGEVIRQAIVDLQAATAELRRVTGRPARPVRAAVRRPARATAPSGAGLFRRLLSAG